MSSQTFATELWHARKRPDRAIFQLSIFGGRSVMPDVMILRKRNFRMTDRCDTNERLSDALMALPQTKAQRCKVPPSLLIAAGHDDHVMIFLLRVGDGDATASAILDYITLGESRKVLKSLRQSGGLIQKRFDIDNAHRLREILSRADTEIAFVRPVSD